MKATPDFYRGDITRAKEAIAQLEAAAPAKASGRHIVRHLMLLRQLAALEVGLARAKEEAASVACPQASSSELGLDEPTL